MFETCCNLEIHTRKIKLLAANCFVFKNLNFTLRRAVQASSLNNRLWDLDPSVWERFEFGKCRSIFKTGSVS